MAVILLATLCALVVLFSGRLPCQSNAYGMFCYALTALGEGRKAFFSEEKKQKTFTSLSRFSPAAQAKDVWQTLLDETERAWFGTFPASPKSDGGLRYSPANSRIYEQVCPNK